MGWNRKDAVGETLDIGDKVVYFRDKSGYNRGEGYDLGSTGFVSSLERPEYEFNGSVKVHLEDGRHTWMCHQDLLKI